MKQAILHGPRDLRLEELSLDTENLGDHDLLGQDPNHGLEDRY